LTLEEALIALSPRHDGERAGHANNFGEAFSRKWRWPAKTDKIKIRSLGQTDRF
jgi:hypothetical protein